MHPQYWQHPLKLDQVRLDNAAGARAWNGQGLYRYTSAPFPSSVPLPLRPANTRLAPARPASLLPAARPASTLVPPHAIAHGSYDPSPISASSLMSEVQRKQVLDMQMQAIQIAKHFPVAPQLDPTESLRLKLDQAKRSAQEADREMVEIGLQLEAAEQKLAWDRDVKNRLATLIQEIRELMAKKQMYTQCTDVSLDVMFRDANLLHEQVIEKNTANNLPADDRSLQQLRALDVLYKLSVPLDPTQNLDTLERIVSLRGQLALQKIPSTEPHLTRYKQLMAQLGWSLPEDVASHQQDTPPALGLAQHNRDTPGLSNPPMTGTRLNAPFIKNLPVQSGMSPPHLFGESTIRMPVNLLQSCKAAKSWVHHENVL